MVLFDCFFFAFSLCGSGFDHRGEREDKYGRIALGFVSTMNIVVHVVDGRTWKC